MTDPASHSSARVRELIESLELQPHPERGHFAETYRARTRVTGSSHVGPRDASTAIYFLVDASAPATHLHRLRSDEIFHPYEGGPLEIVRLFPDGTWDAQREVPTSEPTCDAAFP